MQKRKQSEQLEEILLDFAEVEQNLIALHYVLEHVEPLNCDFKSEGMELVITITKTALKAIERDLSKALERLDSLTI